MAKLRLELECGSAQVSSDDPRWFDPEESPTHPLQEAVVDMALDSGIDGQVMGTDDGTEYHSDAYLYFDPEQIHEVVAILEEVGYNGDILDIEEPLDLKETAMVLRVAREQGWQVN